MLNTLRLILLTPIFIAVTSMAQTLSVLYQLPIQEEAAFHTYFESQGYAVLSKVNGDLDNNFLQDLILVLHKPREDSLSTPDAPRKRLLIILTQQSARKYKLAAANENLIYPYRFDLNFTESFVDVVINKGSFTINHYGGFAIRWGRATTFIYHQKKKDWLFDTDEYTTFHANEPDSILSERIITSKKTGTLSCRDFSLYKEW